MTGERRGSEPGGLVQGFLHPLRWLVTHGMTPIEAAWTVVIGALIGLFPVVGVTSVFCAYAAQRLRLNHLLIQAVNYLVFPLQLLLLIPFIRLGESILEPGKPVELDLEGIAAMLEAGPGQVLGTFLRAAGRAILAWSVTILPLLILVFLGVARRLRVRHSGETI